jgi:hypothetical protein
MTKFDQNSGDIIPEAKAKEWINNYEEGRYKYTPINSMYFGEKIFLKILSLPTVVGIRIHNAVDNEGVFHMLLTGVNDVGEDVYIPYQGDSLAKSLDGGADGGGGEGVGEGGIPCPGGGCP